MKGRYESGAINVTYRINREVNESMDKLTLDPIKNRAKFGLKSKVVNTLLVRLIEARKSGDSTIPVIDLLQELN